MQYVSKARCTDTRTMHIPKNGQQDVDEEISSATTLEEDTERWQKNGENDLANIANKKVSYVEEA